MCILTWLFTLQTLLCKEVPGSDSTGESLDTRHTSVGTEGLRSWCPFPRFTLCRFLSLQATGTLRFSAAKGKTTEPWETWQGLWPSSVVHEPQWQAEGPHTRQAGRRERGVKKKGPREGTRGEHGSQPAPDSQGEGGIQTPSL